MTALTIDDGCDLRHIFCWGMNLSIAKCNHESPSHRSTDDDLVTYPFAGGCVLVHGVEESSPDGGECSSNDPEEWHDADFAQSHTLDDGGEREWDDECQHLDARTDRSVVRDALEVDWKVVLASISLEAGAVGMFLTSTI